MALRWPDDEESLVFKELVLQVIHARCERRFQRNMMSLEFAQDLGEHMVAQLNVFLLGRDVEEHAGTILHQEPTDAWQMLKRDLYKRFASWPIIRWLSRHHPPRMRTHRFVSKLTVQHVYPDLSHEFADEVGRPVIIRKLTTERRIDQNA